MSRTEPSWDTAFEMRGIVLPYIYVYTYGGLHDTSTGIHVHWNEAGLLVRPGGPNSRTIDTFRDLFVVFR